MFNMRSVLFNADHLRASKSAATSGPTRTYKFFQSKNSRPSPPVEVKTTTKETKDVNRKQPPPVKVSNHSTPTARGFGKGDQKPPSPVKVEPPPKNVKNGTTTTSVQLPPAGRMTTRHQSHLHQLTVDVSLDEVDEDTRRLQQKKPSPKSPSAVLRRSPRGKKRQVSGEDNGQENLIDDIDNNIENSQHQPYVVSQSKASGEEPSSLQVTIKQPSPKSPKKQKKKEETIEDSLELPQDQLSPALQEAPSPLQEPLPSPVPHPPANLVIVSRIPTVPIISAQPATTSSSQLQSLQQTQAKEPTVVKKKFFTSKKEGESKAKKPLVDSKTFFKVGEDPFSEDGDFGGSSQKTSSSTTTTMSSSQSSGSAEYWYIEKVRRAHQCHESGEMESFDEDIKYYLNSLETVNTLRVRCLSVEALSCQCMGAEFRMHLRAHDDMPKIIRALSDAPTHPNLAFCTAALMFVYNQDRLTMDIDPEHLKLMLNLLEVKDDEVAIGKEYSIDPIHRKKAKELVEQMKTRGHGMFLDPKKLSTGKLAMEALLGLTSKRAGDWFKEELRNLKGLDFLMNTVISIVGLDNGRLLSMESELSKVDRTLRVLEAATFMHEVNQLYLINYKEGRFINCCTSLLNYCKDSIIRSSSDSKIYLSTLLSVLRVFTNVTSESSRGSNQMGTQFINLFDLFLELLFEVPSFVLPDSRFDLIVLLLCLCINFVEFCPNLREDFLSCGWKLKRLVDILLNRIEEAKETEQQADDILESAEKDKNNEVVNIDTVLNQVVAKSGKHMEHSIIAACISLLLGCSVQDNPEGRNTVADLLPDRSFEPLIDVVRKLQEFAHLADIMTPTGVKRMERILRVFNSPSGMAGESPDKKPARPPSPSLMSISDSFLNDSTDNDTTVILNE